MSRNLACTGGNPSRNSRSRSGLRRRTAFGAGPEDGLVLLGFLCKGVSNTYGIESLGSLLIWAHRVAFHKISPMHMNRYVTEFASRLNNRVSDTVDQMGIWLSHDLWHEVRLAKIWNCCSLMRLSISPRAQ